MSYTTHFLKFPDAEIFDAIASEVGYKFTTEAQLDEDDNVIFPASVSYSTEPTSGPGAIDIIGTIYEDNAVYGEPDEEGMPTLVSAPTPIDGYHVNICLRAGVALPEQFGPYILDPAPSTPSRTFG